MKDVEIHLPLSLIYEAVSHFRRTEDTLLRADGPTLEDNGSLWEKTKHLRMIKSWPDRCHLSEYGQGKEMGN